MMHTSAKQSLELMKFFFSIIISILLAALGYMVTKKLEAIEEQLYKLNLAINNQMVINKTLEMKVEDHEKRIGRIEEMGQNSEVRRQKSGDRSDL